jgi:hypothetical protein
MQFHFNDGQPFIVQSRLGLGGGVVALLKPSLVQDASTSEMQAEYKRNASERHRANTVAARWPRTRSRLASIGLPSTPKPESQAIF